MAATFDLVLCVSAIPYFHNLGQVLMEWQRVARPHGQLIFTVPAAGGLTVNRLLEGAAAAHGVVLADPHAGLGDAPVIRAAVEPRVFIVDDVQSHFFSEPRSESPEDAFARAVSYGFADSLTGLSSRTSSEVFST